ncbi:MAG: hypothetical protein ACT6Q9_04530 [Polaromonas sp.]|uniref:hypothetical protein n=1 Tax=Polaromonas sp. TaxID=1869339 RepID=UPI004036A15B
MVHKAGEETRFILHNPFRSSLEEDLIAFIPGEMVPHFIQSTKTGQGANGHIGWNAWVKRYEGQYVVYDKAAIHRAR